VLPDQERKSAHINVRDLGGIMGMAYLNPATAELIKLARRNRFRDESGNVERLVEVGANPNAFVNKYQTV
jgi:hypothetical protein